MKTTIHPDISISIYYDSVVSIGSYVFVFALHDAAGYQTPGYRTESIKAPYVHILNLYGVSEFQTVQHSSLAHQNPVHLHTEFLNPANVPQ